MKYLKIILYAGTIAGMLIFLYLRSEDMLRLTDLDWQRILVLLSAGLIPVSINAAAFRQAILIFGISLPFKEWYGLSVVNTMYNYLLPGRAGIAIRALYLKQSYALSFSQYTSLTVGMYVLNLLIAAFTGILVAARLHIHGRLNNVMFLFIFVGLFAAMLGILLFLYMINVRAIPGKHKVLRFMKSTAWEIKRFRKNSGKVIILMLLQIFFIFTMGLRLYIVCRFFGIHADYLPLVLINALVAFSLVFSITPGNMGIKEGIVGFSHELLGISFEQAVLAAVLDRMVAIILVFGLGLVSSRLLLNNIKYR